MRLKILKYRKTLFTDDRQKFLIGTCAYEFSESAISEIIGEDSVIECLKEICKKVHYKNGYVEIHMDADLKSLCYKRRGRDDEMIPWHRADILAA